MNQPLISVLIPAYNVEKYLPQCLDSIINQTYTNLQIVIVDDGSKDGTGEICDTYAEKDSRIEIYHIPNGGVANARNFLLSKIKGDYFLFVDADDWILPDTIQFLYGKINHYEAEIATCEMFKDSNFDGKVNFNEEVLDKDSFVKEFLKHNKVNGSLCNKLVKASLVKDNRFVKNISYGEDALFCWGLVRDLNGVVLTDAPKYFYRMNGTSLSHQKWTPEGKGSGKKVWDAIREDVKINYPQFLSILNSRTALECMWALIFASGSDYPQDSHIRERQKFINQHIFDLTKYRLGGFKQYLAALFVGRSYRAGKLINKLLYSRR